MSDIYLILVYFLSLSGVMWNNINHKILSRWMWRLSKWEKKKQRKQERDWLKKMFVEGEKLRETIKEANRIIDLGEK